MKSLEQRFWEKVDKSGECWLWMAKGDSRRYFQMKVGGRALYVHRIAHELLYGPIPDGLQVDHQCNNTRCVRHLKAMTGKENTRRYTDSLTQCKHGHEYDEANTYRDKKGRQCKTCRREKERERKARLRAVTR